MSNHLDSFRDRFIAALPEVPTDLDLGLDEFVQFDPSVVPSSLRTDDADFLVTQGLPRDAAPFLNFCAYSQFKLAEVREVFGVPDSHFPIGHNGSGDVIAVDSTTGQVVYFNHDDHNARVLINSSLRQFADSLCIYQEHHNKRAIEGARSAILAIDPAALQQGAMWQIETSVDPAA